MFKVSHCAGWLESGCVHLQLTAAEFHWTELELTREEERNSYTRYSSSEYILFRILAQPTWEDDAYREVLQAIMLWVWQTISHSQEEWTIGLRVY